MYFQHKKLTCVHATPHVVSVPTLSDKLKANAALFLPFVVVEPSNISAYVSLWRNMQPIRLINPGPFVTPEVGTFWSKWHPRQEF